MIRSILNRATIWNQAFQRLKKETFGGHFKSKLWHLIKKTGQSREKERMGLGRVARRNDKICICISKESWLHGRKSYGRYLGTILHFGNSPYQAVEVICEDAIPKLNLYSEKADYSRQETFTPPECSCLFVSLTQLSTGGNYGFLQNNNWSVWEL